MKSVRDTRSRVRYSSNSSKAQRVANRHSLCTRREAYDRFAGNDSRHKRRLLEYAGTLTEEQLDRELPAVVELLPWRESNKTLRQLLENIIFTKLKKSGPPLCPERKWI